MRIAVVPPPTRRRVVKEPAKATLVEESGSSGQRCSPERKHCDQRLAHYLTRVKDCSLEICCVTWKRI